MFCFALFSIIIRLVLWPLLWVPFQCWQLAFWKMACGKFQKTLGRQTQWKDGRNQTLIPFGMFLASGKSLKPCYEARSRKNTEVLHLVLQGRYPLFAYSHTNEKKEKNKKRFSTINSILQVAVFATGHAVLPQFLARKVYCEGHTCLALFQV